MKMKLMIVLLCVGILNAAGCEYTSEEMSAAQLEAIQKRLEASQTVPAAQPDEGVATDEVVQPEGENADAARIAELEAKVAELQGQLDEEAAPERLLGPKSPCTDHSQCESGWCGEFRMKNGESRKMCFAKKPAGKKRAFEACGHDWECESGSCALIQGENKCALRGYIRDNSEMLQAIFSNREEDL